MADAAGRRIAATLAVLFVVALFVLFLGRVAEILLVRQTRLSRGPALALAVAGTLAALVGVGWLIVPAVVQQTQDLFATLPQQAQRLESLLGRLVTKREKVGNQSRSLVGGSGFTGAL